MIRLLARSGAALSVRTACVIVLAVVLSAVIATAALTIAGSRERSASDATVARETTEMGLYEDARAAGLLEGGALASYIVSRDERYLDDVAQSRRRVDDALGALRELDGTSSDRERVDALIVEHHAVASGFDAILAAVEGGSPGDGRQTATSLNVEDRARQFYASLETAADQQARSLLATQDAASAAQARWDRVLLSLLAALIVFVIFVALVMLYWLVRPLERLRVAAESVAAGHLDTPADVDGPADIRRLATAFRAMSQSLIARVAEVEAYLSRDLESHAAKLERANATLREQARRDSLTGALNHAGIMEEARRLMPDDGSGRAHCIAMVDVNGLKAINDVFGHQAGDTVLATVATALSRRGAIVGRYGGDEFVAILPNASRRGGERYRREVLNTLAHARIVDAATRSPVLIQVSVGLAQYPADGAVIHDLLGMSDSEMYAAKRHRPPTDEDEPALGALRNADAAQLVGQVVPLLTAPIDGETKLRLASQRISSGAGYDAVNITMFADTPGAPLANSTAADVAEELIQAWDENQSSDEQREFHPIRAMLDDLKRPIIIDDPWNDERLWPAQRDILRAAGLQTALVAPLIWEDEVVGMLGVASKREHAFGPTDAHFLSVVATHVTAIVRMAALFEQVQSSADHLARAHEDTVLLLAAAAEAHDQRTGEHLQNLHALTELLARELGFVPADARRAGLAAVLHDIGKIRVPEALLSSTGSLAHEEWDLMKHHTTWGAEFLSGRPELALAASVARSHHERWDGAGYPDGLAGDDIPEVATIVAVADAFDAMTTGRPYRAPRSVAAAVREITSCAGTQFSPRVVEGLVQLHKRRKLYSLRNGQEKRAA